MKKFVIYSENIPLYGRIFYVTSKENYEAVIRNASKVLYFNGTIQEAVEYVKKYLWR